METTIYWLVDVRPETLANGWPNGFPFYCGKTVNTLEARLAGHRADARANKTRPVCAWVRMCGRHIRIVKITTVPDGEDWSIVERQWIAFTRRQYIVNANATAGSNLPSGHIYPLKPAKPLTLTAEKQRIFDEFKGGRKLKNINRHRLHADRRAKVLERTAIRARFSAI